MLHGHWHSIAPPSNSDALPPSPRPRRANRPPLDFSILAHSDNSPLEDTSETLYFTIPERHSREAAQHMANAWKPILEENKTTLLKWEKKGVEAACSEEGIQAVKDGAQAVASTLLTEHSERILNNKVFEGSLLPYCRRKYWEKFVSEARGKADGRCRFEGERRIEDEGTEITETAAALFKSAGLLLEDRYRRWLESQGVLPWSSIAQDQAAEPRLGSLAEVGNFWGSGGGTQTEGETVYYVTEAEISAHQISSHGRRWCTPDFLLVDRLGYPVQVPMVLSPAASKTARSECFCCRHNPDAFCATVLEVKGHFLVPGMSPSYELERDKIKKQIYRYRDNFGPTLMLQKRGMCEVTLRSLAEKPSGVAVLSINQDKLPLSELPDPWFCEELDNYDFDPVYQQRNRNFSGGSGAHRSKEKPKFPSISSGLQIHSSTRQRTVLNEFSGWGVRDPLAYAAFCNDQALLSNLRKEIGTFLCSLKVGKWNRQYADRILFGGWEGRMFQKGKVMCRASKEEAQAQAEAERIEAERWEGPDVESWEDLLDEPIRAEGA